MKEIRIIIISGNDFLTLIFYFRLFSWWTKWTSRNQNENEVILDCSAVSKIFNHGLHGSMNLPWSNERKMGQWLFVQRFEQTYDKFKRLALTPCWWTAWIGAPKDNKKQCIVFVSHYKEKSLLSKHHNFCFSSFPVCPLVWLVCCCISVRNKMQNIE